MKNRITDALFNAYDIKKTIQSNGLSDVKRVHGGTENEDTLDDLITSIIQFLEEIDEPESDENDEKLIEGQDATTVEVICPECLNEVDAPKFEQYAECSDCKLVWTWQETDRKAGDPIIPLERQF